jgi:hypothetical protein
MTTLKRIAQFLVAALLFTGFAQAASADSIGDGTFNISGTIYIADAGSSAVVTPAGTCPANTSCIFWQDGSGTMNGKADISTAGLPNGDIPVSISGNDAANLASILIPPGTIGTTISEPFMTFNNGGVTTVLTLTEIFPGSFSATQCAAAPAVGQTCTFDGLPFSFVNNPPAPGQASMSWAMQGTTDAPGVTWFGDFTSQFNTPYQTVLGTLLSGGYEDATFSATIDISGGSGNGSAPTPEPGTIALLALGVGSLLVLRRRISWSQS